MPLKNNIPDIPTDIFENIFENATVGVFIVDVPSGIISRINSYGNDIFGYEGEELIGEKVEVLIPSEYAKGHENYHESFLKKPVHRPMGTGLDLWGLKKDGTKFSVEISLSPVKINEKIYAVAFVQDIGGRTRAENRLKENEARLKAVINSAVDGIVTINRRGVIQTANAAVTRLFQYENHELIGQNIKILMPTSHSHQHDGYLKNYHDTGRKKIIGIGREVAGRRKDGSEFPIHLSVSEAFVNDEVIYTGIIHDLTHIKQVKEAELERSRWLEDYAENLEREVTDRTSALRRSELKLRDSLKKERELNDLKSRFVSMASHEFRTPLSTVLSSTELVEMYLEVNNFEKIDKNIKRIKKSVDHLNGILNDFLSLEKLETGKVNVNRKHFFVDAFIQEIIEDTQVTLKTGQKIITDRKGDNEIISDPFLLKNILFNLLSNASKYSPEGKDIFLSVSNTADELTLKVRDEGIGIPTADKKNMFTRFFRASNVENIKGTGLGLTIVKRYADLLSGSISYASEIGEGTEFSVVLPRRV